jgi:hypothetical protein
VLKEKSKEIKENQITLKAAKEKVQSNYIKFIKEMTRNDLDYLYEIFDNELQSKNNIEIKDPYIEYEKEKEISSSYTSLEKLHPYYREPLLSAIEEKALPVINYEDLIWIREERHEWRKEKYGNTKTYEKIFNEISKNTTESLKEKGSSTVFLSRSLPTEIYEEYLYKMQKPHGRNPTFWVGIPTLNEMRFVATFPQLKCRVNNAVYRLTGIVIQESPVKFSAQERTVPLKIPLSHVLKNENENENENGNRNDVFGRYTL